MQDSLNMQKIIASFSGLEGAIALSTICCASGLLSAITQISQKVFLDALEEQPIKPIPA
jgi:hypothetical protein